MKNLKKWFFDMKITMNTMKKDEKKMHSCHETSRPPGHAAKHGCGARKETARDPGVRSFIILLINLIFLSVFFFFFLSNNIKWLKK
jgi:hypothetical protein